MQLREFAEMKYTLTVCNRELQEQSKGSKTIVILSAGTIHTDTCV